MGYVNPCRPAGIGPNCVPSQPDTLPADRTSGSLGGGKSTSSTPKPVTDSTAAETADGGPAATGAAYSAKTVIVDDSNNPNSNENRGPAEKKRCMDDEKKRCIDNFMQSCMCSCLAELGGSDGTLTIDGGGYHCYAKCIEKTDCDFKQCYCQEEICSSSRSDPNSPTNDPSLGEDGTSTTTTTDAPPEAKYVDDNYGAVISSLNTQSAYDIGIPLIFSRGIVSGNIIWAGNPVRKTHTVTEVSTSGNTTTTTNTLVTQTYVDIAVALCRGEIAGIGRVWNGDTVVFDAIAELDVGGEYVPSETKTISIKNSSFFSPGDNKDKYDETNVVMTVYNGADDQRIDPVLSSSDVATPAYRGLAYVIFKNFEVSLSNGSIPALRFEIIENASEVPVKQSGPTEDAFTSALTSEILIVDSATRDVLTGAVAKNGIGVNSGLRLSDFDTLGSKKVIAPGVTTAMPNTLASLDPSTAQRTSSGRLLIQNGDRGGQRPLMLVNIDNNVLTSTYGQRRSATDPSPDSITDLYNVLTGSAACIAKPRERDGRTPHYMFALSDNDAAILRFNDFETTVARGDTGSGVNIFGNIVRKSLSLEIDEVLPDASGEPTIIRNNYVFAFSSPFSMMNAITVHTAKLNSSAGISYFDPTQSLGSLFSTKVIPPSAWGGVVSSSLKIHDVVYNSHDTTFLIWLKDAASAGGYVFKWDHLTNKTLWSVFVPYQSPASGGGDRYNITKKGLTTFKFVGSNGDIYALDTVSGGLEKVDTLTRFGLPNIEGAQYYDAFSDTVTYIAQGALHRAYLSMITAESTPVSAVVRKLLDICGLGEEQIDVTALDGTMCEGFVIENGNVSGVLKQLSEIFAFTVADRGGRLVFTMSSTGTSIAATTQQMSITKPWLERTRMDDFSRPRTYVVEYLDSGNGLSRGTQTIHLPIIGTADEVLTPTQSLSTSYPVVCSAVFAKQMAERLLASKLVSNESSAPLFGPEMLHLEAGDILDLTDGQGLVHKMRVRALAIGADRSIEVAAVREDLSFYTALAMATDSVDPHFPTTGNDNGVDTRGEALRPAMMLTNAIELTDALGGDEPFTTRFYAGVLASTLTLPAPVALYSSANGSFLRNVGSVSKPLTWGILTGDTPGNVAEFYRFDRTTRIQLAMTSPEQAATLTSSTMSALIANERLNLVLIGDELIQFRDATVSPTDPASVELSFLLRGRRGTEWAVWTHVANEPAVFYDKDAWLAITHPITGFKDLTNVGVLRGSAANRQFNLTDRLNTHHMTKSYAPSNVKHRRINTNDIFISWNRRNRNDINDELGNEIPVELQRSNYEVHILNEPYDPVAMAEALDIFDAGGISPYIKRTIPDISETPQATYKAGDQTVDGFVRGEQDLHLVIYQTGDSDSYLYRGHPAYVFIGAKDV